MQNQAKKKKSADELYSPDIDSYDEKTYNKRGWAYVNEVLFGRMGPDISSKYMAKETNDYVVEMPNGTIAISTGANFGVNDTVVFIKGPQVDPTITQIVTISRYRETSIAPIREQLLDFLKEGRSYDSIRRLLEGVAEEEILHRFNVGDFDTFGELKNSKSINEHNVTDYQEKSNGKRNNRRDSSDTDRKSLNLDPDTQNQARKKTRFDVNTRLDLIET